MSSDSIIPFDFSGNDLRGLLDENGDPLFVANDICQILNIDRQQIRRLDEDEKGVRSIHTPGGMQQMSVVNESGLYSLIMGSRKSDAKVFKRWVMHEVLPAIRKTGSYTLQSLTPAEAFLQIAQQMVKNERAIAELNESLGDIKQDIEGIHAELLDADYYTVRGWCRKQRIDYTTSLLIMWGKEATALSAARNIERKEIMENDSSVGRYHKSVLLDVCVPKPKTNGQLALI